MGSVTVEEPLLHRSTTAPRQMLRVLARRSGALDLRSGPSLGQAQPDPFGSARDVEQSVWVVSNRLVFMTTGPSFYKISQRSTLYWGNCP